MRTLLTFAGSVIYLLVMAIIWPLLLLVYTGIEAIDLFVYVKQHKPVLAKLFTTISFPHLSFHFPAKKHMLSLWTKAARFHL